MGGYTAVSSMANTEPVTDHAAIVAEVKEKAAAAGLADVFPVGAITKGLAGESIAEMGEMVEAGVRVFSDDGNCVPTARTLRNALTYAKAFPVDVVIADHCEDPSLVQDGHMHEGVHSYSLGLAGRPAEAEETIVARDIAMARMTGGPPAPVPSVQRRDRWIWCEPPRPRACVSPPRSRRITWCSPTRTCSPTTPTSR